MTAVLAMDRVGLRLQPTVEALADISLRVQPGEVVGLAGPAGAGKTLLLEVAALHRPPTRGALHLFGEDIGRPECTRPVLRRRLGAAWPSLPALGALAAMDAAALPLRIGGATVAEARARATELLAWLDPALDPRQPAPPAAWPQVAVAQALLASRELVLVDEVGTLPPPLFARLAVLVAQLAGQGTAFLFADRDERRLAALGATPYLLDRGRLAGGS